jgi:hypothetical protein
MNEPNDFMQKFRRGGGLWAIVGVILVIFVAVLIS